MRFAIDVHRLSWYYIHKRDGRPVPAGRGHLQPSKLRNAASLLGSGGGYLFSSIPSRIAAIISISNAMVSVALIGFTSLLSPEDGPASLACLHDSTIQACMSSANFDFVGVHKLRCVVLCSNDNSRSEPFGFLFSAFSLYTRKGVFLFALFSYLSLSLSLAFSLSLLGIYVVYPFSLYSL